jgi:pyrimidine-nucleoside phosphorylase
VTTSLIERKRDGEALSGPEWRGLLSAYAAGGVPDYQMAAMAMAVVFRGLSPAELDAVTDAMLESGERLRFNHAAPRVDKHSTGGVGDKTSLLLVPLVAACGVQVPMMSGRSLGHTGGTLDKLEAIPGFQTRLSLHQAVAQVERIGCAMLGQTEEIAPADRRLYALRDVTGTVESVPLISASIMSKKLAEGLSGLVLDVKRGSGAFLPSREQALELARTMIALGSARGCRTVALLTAMDRPLGHACGNALEVEEAIAGLRGEGPPDLMEVTMVLGVEMLMASDPALTPAAAQARLSGALARGAALDKLRELVAAQGGNPAVVDDPALLPQAAVTAVFTAPRDGVIAEVRPRVIGRGIIGLGGGRRQVSDAIDPAAGFVITAKPGQRVTRGEPLATVHAADAAALARGRAVLDEAIVVGEVATPLPLVSHRITEAGVEVVA